MFPLGLWCPLNRVYVQPFLDPLTCFFCYLADSVSSVTCFGCSDLSHPKLLYKDMRRLRLKRALRVSPDKGGLGAQRIQPMPVRIRPLQFYV